MSNLYRATVVTVGTDTISIKIPALTQAAVYKEVPFYGTKPSVDDEILVGFLGDGTAALTPVAITNTASGTGTTVPAGDITGVTAGLGLSGGGTIGTVSLAFAPSELSSVTVATDDKVVIADTSDSDNPKHVTVSSIAALATASPAGSDHQVQWNNSGSFGADANFTYDGSNLTVKVPLTVGVDDTGHDVKFFGATSGKYMEWDESADQLDVTGSLDVTGNTTMVGTLTVGVDDTGHDVKFFGATSGSYMLWDESADALIVNAGPVFATAKMQTGQSSFTQEPWSASTIALGNYGGIGTQGSYRTAMSWNYERGADGNFHHLDVNSYPQAGDFSIGNTGFIFNFDTDYESAHTTNPTAIANITTLGEFNAVKGGADGGIVLGQAFGSSYVGLRTAGMANDSGDEYILISNGGDTFISAGTGAGDDLYLRAGGNSTTCQIHLDTSANDINVTGDIVSSDDITCAILNVTDEIRVGDGSSGDPGYTFTSDSSVGMFYGGTNTLSFSAAAVELTMTATSLYPAYNEGLSLGQAGNVWNHFWLGQATTFSSGGYYTLRSRDSDRQVMELTSSERFKKDIVDLPLSEAYKVLDARPIKYRGIDDDASVPLEVGLSAESLHNAGYEYAVRYDEGHWGTTPRSIYYEYLTAPLIAIIKDLKTRLEALES